MANFDITLHYLVLDNGDSVHMTSATISAATTETISKNCTTSVSANGDINLDTGDTANLTFQLDNDDDWHLSFVYLKDHDRAHFGAISGEGNALDDDEEIDYPDADQESGMIRPPGTAPMSVTFSDTNRRNKTVDYMVVFEQAVTGKTATSDPRVRDSGGSD